MSSDCAFCAIIAGQARASVIINDGAVVAFLDLRQAVPGHVLVVPRRHVPNIYALQPVEAAAVMQAAVRVAQALRAQFDPPGLSLWQSNGEAAMQEVPHFHLHVHPRQHRDGLLHVYPDGLPTPADAKRLDALAVDLRQRLGE